MPQPPTQLLKYLASPLPSTKDQFAPGGGGTGARQEWQGELEGVSVIEGFQGLVEKYTTSTLSSLDPLPAHPAHPYPHFLTASKDLGDVIKSAQDLQRHLRTIPLAAVAASLTALKAHELGEDLSKLSVGQTQKGVKSGAALDRAGYESDGGEEFSNSAEPTHSSSTGPHASTSPTYGWKFSKSPLGSGEFLLIDESKPQEVLLVVRTINSSAFGPSDWEDLVQEGPYRYNTKSKASWYISRKYGATKRLGCQFFAFTDYQRWCFGAFTSDRRHMNISPVIRFDSTSPVSVLQALFYWSRSALGEAEGYKPVAKDVSGKKAPYAGVGRSGSISGGGKKSGGAGVTAGAESDIEEEDAA